MALCDRISSFQRVANAKAANPANPRQPAGGGELARLAELALAKPRRENLQTPAPLPGWCRPDCKHLRHLALRGLPAIFACYHRRPGAWGWFNLARMSGCPLAKGKDPLPPLPPALPPPPPPCGTGPSRDLAERVA